MSDNKTCLVRWSVVDFYDDGTYIGNTKQWITDGPEGKEFNWSFWKIEDDMFHHKHHWQSEWQVDKEHRYNNLIEAIVNALVERTIFDE